MILNSGAGSFSSLFHCAQFKVYALWPYNWASDVSYPAVCKSPQIRQFARSVAYDWLKLTCAWHRGCWLAEKSKFDIFRKFVQWRVFCRHRPSVDHVRHTGLWLAQNCATKILKIYLVLVHYLIFRRGHRMWREYGAAYAKVLQKFVWLFSAIEILEEISLNRGYSTVFERVSVAWSLACPEKSKWKFWHQY